MMLPTLDRPTYTTKILSRPEPIQFIPYTVKEGMALMMAKEANDLDSMVGALRQILSVCLLDKTIDVDQLPMVDMEWLFLQIQARSVGEKIPLYFKCINEVNGNQCGMMIETEIDLLTVKISPENSNTKIALSDKIGLNMKYPTFGIVQRAAQRMNGLVKGTANPNGVEDITLAALCIDYVYDETGVYKASEAGEDEMVGWVTKLAPGKYELIEKFFNNCPEIRHTVAPTCPKCGFHHKILLEGLEDFFV